MARHSSAGKIIAVAALGFVVLLIVLVARALMLESRQLIVEPAERISIDAEAAVQHLAGAIRFRTISDDETSAEEKAAALGQLAAFREYLVATYPLLHARLTREIVAEHSLLYTWQGRDASLEPMLLAAHMDVVPADESDAAWTHPPFDGVISDGFVWGRGAIDDKLCVIAILEAVEHLLGEGFEPQRTAYLAFGHDEEIGGTGAAAIATLLESRGVKLDMVLDEGLPIAVGMTPGVEKPVAYIGVAEKGYTTVQLTVEAEGGHSSTPPRQTAIGIAAAGVKKIEENPFPARMSGVARDMLRWLAPESRLAHRVIFANDWLFAPVIERLLSQSPETDALIRTTTAVTVMDGGIKDNVLPRTARVIVNFRSLPGDDPEEIVQHVREAVDDERVNVQIAGEAWGSDQPSPLDSEQFEQVNRAVREVYADTLVAPGLMLGATDARRYGGLTRNVFRFTPAPMTSEDVARIHGVNEQVAISSVDRSVTFYRGLLGNPNP